jgi:hypothetical protein
MYLHTSSIRHFLELAERAFAHAAAIVLGFALMVLGLAMGVTMVLLPVGLPVGLAGVLLFVWGIVGEFAEPSSKA